MTTLTVDPAQYAAAASDLTEVARQTQSALGLLSGALGASGGMGGSDNAGVEWATSYDEGARTVLDAASSAVGAAGNVALRLHATGANHAHADASSTIGGGDASIPGAPTPPMSTCPSVPSASGGGGGDEPPGWGLVSGMVGYLWPNGHQDRLHAADGAWKAAAAGLQLAAAPTAAAASRVQAQHSPESAAAAKACTDTGEYLRELSTVCTQLGNSCSEYAGHLDQAHHEIISTLKELLIETAAIEAAGAAFAFFTAGLDEVAAQAAVAARIATAVAKIRRVIEVLIEAARVVATSVGRLAGRAGELLGKLKPMEEGAVKRVDDLGPVSRAAKVDAPKSASGLTDDKIAEIKALDRGQRPDPSEYISAEKIAEHRRLFDEGASRLSKESDLKKYGIARVEDGTSFVMPKSDVDALLEASKGDPRVLEDFMGLPHGQLQNAPISRIDIENPGQFGARMPSGNEAGANSQWLPGGYLPGGIPEAVIDAGKIPDALKIVSRVN